MLFVVFFLKSTAWDQNGLWGFKEWTRKPNLLCFAFLLMKLSNYIMGNKRHLPFPSSTLCVVDRSNQYRPHVVSMGYRCDIAVSDEYKNAGKQTILIFWQFLHWGAKFVILNWPLWDKNWSLTWACVSSILAPAGALLFSISQHFTSNISPNTSNIFWKYFALELYFWSSESGKILAFEESESGSEYGVCCDPGGPQTLT